MIQTHHQDYQGIIKVDMPSRISHQIVVPAIGGPELALATPTHTALLSQDDPHGDEAVTDAAGAVRTKMQSVPRMREGRLVDEDRYEYCDGDVCHITI